MRRASHIPIAFFATVWPFAAAAIAQVVIDVDSLTVVPGAPARVAVTLRAGDEDVGGTANVIHWNAPLRLRDCQVNPAIQRPATVFAYLPAGCSTQCTSVRAIVLSLSIAPPLRDGDVLYTCEIEADAAAIAGDYPLNCDAAEAAASDGTPIEASCGDGMVGVLPATPTVPASPVPSPTAPTTARPCPGDCDGDGRVSIEELVVAVRIALGTADLELCPSIDADGDGDVSIAELVQAVRAAIGVCP